MYAKIFSQIYDGTLCTKGPWQALVTFQQLLVLADQDGAVDMTVAAIARRTTIPLEIIEVGIEELMQPDLESRTPAEDGRRIVPLSEGRTWGWRIVNYTHYRQLQREEERREYHRQYWHTRKLNNSTSTQQPQPTQPNQPIAEAEAKAKGDGKPSSAARPLLSEIPDDLFTEFVQLRKTKKAAAISKTVATSIRREADIAGISLEEAVRACCEFDWKTFNAGWYADRTKRTTGHAAGAGSHESKPWEGAR